MFSFLLLTWRGDGAHLILSHLNSTPSNLTFGISDSEKMMKKSRYLVGGLSPCCLFCYFCFLLRLLLCLLLGLLSAMDWSARCFQY